jgi:hypothetical protein
MEAHSHLIRWERRTPDWTVAAVSGFAAGAVLMVLDIIWSTFYAGGPWRTAHMIAPIFVGPEAWQTSDFGFSIAVVGVSLVAHYVLGIVFGLVLATIMASFHLDENAGLALVTGAVFGIVLYVINFYGMARMFPWLAEMRGWPHFSAHLVFGIVAALLYWKLERTGTQT